MSFDQYSFQLERIDSIRDWYYTYYQDPLDMPSVVKYIVLWAVFNALYNVVDLPNRKVIGVKQEYEHRMPTISYSKEPTKLKRIAKFLSLESNLIEKLVDKHRDALEIFANRGPEIQQPKKVASIEIKGKQEIFRFGDIRGIASIDQRCFTEDGTVLFEYASLDFEVDSQGQVRDGYKFVKQLIFFLYQLRNNIVHGGSATIPTAKRLANDALPVLETIVEHIFEHSEAMLASAR